MALQGGGCKAHGAGTSLYSLYNHTSHNVYYVKFNAFDRMPAIVASQECWHPAIIRDPDLALAINSLSRLVDRIIGLHRLLTLIVSLPLSNPNAELAGNDANCDFGAYDPSIPTRVAWPTHRPLKPFEHVRMPVHCP